MKYGLYGLVVAVRFVGHHALYNVSGCTQVRGKAEELFDYFSIQCVCVGVHCVLVFSVCWCSVCVGVQCVLVFSVCWCSVCVGVHCGQCRFSVSL